MVDNIYGKKILFFCPAFFNYENIIADKMREMGAEVDMYNVRSVSSAFNRALLKVCHQVFNKHSISYYNDILNQNARKEYDYILIVKCDMTPISILKKIKEMFPSTKLCLYLYDSINNIPGIEAKLKYFDTIHSFDYNDCERHSKMKFRPLFFADQYRRENGIQEKYEYDISFIGTIHSDRFRIIKQVQRIADKKGLKSYWFLYLQSRFIYWFYKLTKREFRGVSEDTFSFKKKTAEEISSKVAASKVILDIQHPKQTGLTMRTIEMIGMNKKLITTNENITTYDFYSPTNIMIIQRDKVRIPESFFLSSYKLLPKEVYERYSLERWIYDVLE